MHSWNLSIFNRYMGRKSLFFISKSSGDIIISYMEDNAIFVQEWTLQIVCNDIQFSDVKTTKICPREWHSRHIKPINCDIFLFLMKQYNIRINPYHDTWCRWMFYLFFHKIVVYRIFLYFQYGFQNGHQRSRDYIYYHYFK